MIESVIKQLENSWITSYTNTKSKDHLIRLETRKIHLLRQKEETWNIKRKEILLKVGDENPKFFQQYSRGKKNTNIILYLRDQTSREANTFN